MEERKEMPIRDLAKKTVAFLSIPQPLWEEMRKLMEEINRKNMLEELERIRQELDPSGTKMARQLEELGLSSQFADEIIVREHMKIMRRMEQQENTWGPMPQEIKRRLKYAKNPMEIQQLNRQLAKAYKEYGRKKK